VEKRGKAESRKKKAEIAKRIIACGCFVNSLRNLVYSLRFTPALLWEHKCSVVASKATVPLCRPSSKRDNYFYLYKTHTTAIHTQRGTAILLCVPLSAFYFLLSTFCFLLSAFNKQSHDAFASWLFLLKRLLIT